MMQQGKRHLLLEPGFGRRRESNPSFFRGIKKEFDLWNVFEVKQLKEAIEHSDSLSVGQSQGVFGEAHVLRGERISRKTGLAQARREPGHLRPVILRFF